MSRHCLSIRLSFISIAAALLIAPIASAAGPPAFGDPVQGLTPAQAAAFAAGKIEFATVEDVLEGLGPVFNGRSCGECHTTPALGGGSTTKETRFGRTLTNGVFDPMTEFGGSLIQNQAIGPADLSPHQFIAETVPGAATTVAGRRTTPLFGLGLVDAVPDDQFKVLAFLQKLLTPATAGKVSAVTNVDTGLAGVGKFGWKAQVPTLHVFSGDAYLNEMGITNPSFPNENCPGGNCGELKFNPRPGLNDTGTGVTAFTDFMTMLAPPPRGPRSLQTEIGNVIAGAIGCLDCHTQTLVTGSSPVAALDHKAFQPFSDFLLHEMGSLGDGIVQNTAGQLEMRTAPLWGLRMITTFLHDGRATTLDAAILAHDGQALAARNRFAALSANDKSFLRAFLNSL